MKTCSNCKDDKEYAEFRIRTERRRAGTYIYLNNTCRTCDAELAKKYYSKKRGDEKFKQNNRERVSKYRIDNYDAVYKREQERRKGNNYKVWLKQWRQKNKNKIREDNKKRNKKYINKIIKNIDVAYCKRLKLTAVHQVQSPTSKTKTSKYINATIPEIQIIVARKRIIKIIKNLEL